MEVRKGYKKTDMGIVPEDWLVEPFQNFFSFISYGFTNPMPTAQSGIYMVTAKDINNGKLQFDTARFTTEEAYRTLLTDKSRPKKGDLLLTKDGALGRVALVDDRVICINQSVAIIRLNNKAVPGFIKVLLESPVYQQRMLEDAGGTTIKHIYITIVDKMPIVLPPTHAEQEAIAEALSDADALIESLEALLAKKRQVKQGAMSELLTGKRRAVESGEWEVKRLGDIFDISAGGDFDPARSSDVQDERFPYPIYSNAITDNGLYGFCSYNDHQSGSITVTARGTLGVSNYRDHDFTAIGRVIVLKPTKPLDGRFISEYINNRIEFVVESTGVPQLTAPQISKYEILFPPFEEQTAIAEILSDMDAEIRALEEKLSKARAVKAGMMSELLTGRVRLV